MAAARPRLLESIAIITGAIPRKGSVATGSSLGDASRRSPRPADERGDECADHPVSGRGIHLPGLSRLHRISRRHAERPARHRCRGGGVRARAAKASMLQPFLKRLSDANIPHLSVRQQIRQGARARCARCWRCCRRPAKRRCCCARFRSGNRASPPALSIWRWSGPLPIAPTPPAR